MREPQAPTRDPTPAWKSDLTANDNDNDNDNANASAGQRTQTSPLLASHPPADREPVARRSSHCDDLRRISTRPAPT
jgi:hypothetical protein